MPTLLNLIRAPSDALTVAPAFSTDDDRSDSSLEHATKGDCQVDSQTPHAFVVRKLTLDNEASRIAKRFHNDQEPLVCSSTNSESVRNEQDSSSEENFPLPPHEPVLSRVGSYICTGSSNRSGLAKESINGFFPNSRKFVIQRPLMVDNSQRHYTQGDQPDGALLWLKDFIVEGAEFDSPERDPPPRCHRNTRVSIVKGINNWINDHHREKKMHWVRGAAGVGKSAVVQTIFEQLPNELRGGSMFFGTNERNHPNKVFPTIAYRLAVLDLSYRAYLKELLMKDPRSLNKSLREQFRILFEEPFAKRKLLNRQDALVITLDGLDKCGDQTSCRRRSSEDAQREIVELISHFILQNSSAPFIWLVSSRPEKHLLATFTGEKVKFAFSEEEIPVDSVQACQDVKAYLYSEFERIQKKHPDLLITTPWPSSEDFSLIATKASGLFIFAEAVIRFIDDSNPIEKLKYALIAISNASSFSSFEVTQNPLAILDDMYDEIVSRLPSERLEPATRIIGTIAEFDHKCVPRSIGTLPIICNILNIPRDIAITALCYFRPVLHFPGNIESSRPRFYHVSFRDFLENKSRSRRYSIEGVKVGDELVKGLMRYARRESLDDESLPWPGNGDSRLLVDMAQKEYDLPSLLSFRARFFCSEFAVSEGVVAQFLRAHDFAADHSHVLLMVLIQEETAQVHERLGVTRREPIGSLGITGTIVSKCKISKKRLNCYVVSLNEFRSSSEDEEIQRLRSILCRWIEVKSKRLVRVWGHEQFKRSVVFRLSYDPAIIKLFGRSFCYRRRSLDIGPDIAVVGF